MKPSRIRILYRGRAGTTRKLLVDLLTRAGYTVTAETRADQDVSPKASDVIIVSPDGGRSGRTLVLTGEVPVSQRVSRVGRRGPRPDPTGAMNLQQLREHVRQTQGDVARRAAVSQPQLSRVEGRRDHLVSTLRKYVRALGGDVAVVAQIGSQRIVLRDV